jgi:hypothetical protein
VRIETKRLLDRLGQPDFQYREYGESQPAQVERWPLFELVSRQMRYSRSPAADGDIAKPTRPSEDGGNSIQSLASRISMGLGR